jgi:hypothetical protein
MGAVRHSGAIHKKDVRSITLRYVTKPGSAGTTLHYTTLPRAQKAAQSKVGSVAGIASDRMSVISPDGHCLFFKGVTFEELFPL